MKRILIFLFVNGKCYGTQLNQVLKTPLTPIQKALLRLEKGGIISSYYVGKTRVYQFNPAYSLLSELEQLLKKAYTLLPPHEKKQYSLLDQEVPVKHHKDLLNKVWDRLSAIKTLTFHAKTKSKEDSGWNGVGNGDVIVNKDNSTVLIFNEKGSWKNKEGGELDFSNVFRWTFDRNAGMISLEHLRLGLNNPIFLFHLAPSKNQSLISVDAHLCGGDAYFGQVHVNNHHIRLNWRVIGPKKNEEIDYYYS